MGDFDITSKYLIEAGPRDWLALAGLPIPADPAAVVAVDADLSTVSNAPDKLIRVDDPTEPYIAHIEFQSGADVRFDDRMLLYNVLARWRHRRPVRSVAVLLRPDAVARNLAGGVREVADGRERLTFAYDLVRVWELPVETILSGGVAILPLAPVSAVEPRDLPGVIARMRDRLEREVPRPTAADLWQSTEVFLGLRYDDQLIQTLLTGVMNMTESVVYQRILAKGKVDGIPEGERKILIRLATQRFGPPSAEALARLSGIDHAAELERLGDALAAAASWDDWLRN